MALSAYRHLLRSIRIAFQGPPRNPFSPPPPLIAAPFGLFPISPRTHLKKIANSYLITYVGDSRVLFAARDKARQDFDALRTLAPHSPEAQAGVAHAREVARVLRTNVVQGVQVEEEKYRE